MTRKFGSAKTLSFRLASGRLATHARRLLISRSGMTRRVAEELSVLERCLDKVALDCTFGRKRVTSTAGSSLAEDIV